MTEPMTLGPFHAPGPSTAVRMARAMVKDRWPKLIVRKVGKPENRGDAETWWVPVEVTARNGR